MDSAESVGDVQLCHVGQFLSHSGIVLLLAGIEAQVLQQHDLAALQCSGLGLGILAHDVLGEDDLAAQQLAQTLSHDGEGEVLLPLALGLAQMGAGDDGGAVIQQIVDGGESGDDTLVAGDLTGGLILRHVEIAAQQHLLAGHFHVHDGLLVIVHIVSPFKKVVDRFILLPFRLRPAVRGNRFAAVLHR